MPKPFKGIINLDSRDSVPDWEPYAQPKAPGRNMPGKRSRAIYHTIVLST